MEVYAIVSEYMKYYNCRRRHGSIKYMAPKTFYEAIQSKTTSAKPFVA